MKLFRALSFLFFSAMLAGLVGCGPKMTLPVLGNAPAWKLKDVDGNVFSSDQLKGKVVIVDFWATWCVPCREEMPAYIELQKKYGKKGLVIVGVSVDEGGVKPVKDFAQKIGVNYPIVMGNDEIQTGFGGLDLLPTAFLIDRSGKVRDKKRGVTPHEAYVEKVRSVLAE